MKRIAVFASGSGSNAENLIRYFFDQKEMEVSTVYSNNPNAGVVERARKWQVPVKQFSKNDFTNTEKVLISLKEEQTDLIVLAGFLLMVPPNILLAFPRRILNIHPALLPDHGGRGYYGERVHQSVLASGATMSGITIHQVNERFDDGELIFQAACHVEKNETVQSLSIKIHALEHQYFPVVVEKYLSMLPS